MFAIIINTLLYFFAFIIYWNKKKVYDTGFVLLITYLITAVCCLVNYSQHISQWQLTLWPFLYLFVVLLLFFRPFLMYSTESIPQRLRINNSDLFLFFSIVFVILSGAVVYYNISNGIDNLLSADWFAIRNKMYEGEIEFYNSQLERFIKIFVGYSSPLAILLAFYYLTNRKGYLSILLFLSVALTYFSSSILNASRGRMFFLVLELIVGYLFFKSNLSHKAKRSLFFSSLALIGIILSYSLAITFSRFETSLSFDSTGDSLWYYFGHSMLTFDYGIADSIEHFMWGDFILGTNANRYLSGVDYVAGTHFGSAFFTFAGAIYLDYGPILTFIIALLVPIPIIMTMKKRIYDMADLFLMFFAVDYMLQGITAVGRGYIVRLLMAIAIYVLLKFVRNRPNNKEFTIWRKKY